MTDPTAVPETGTGGQARPQGGRPPAALAAFLRGVERRGAVLAELQCGDADAGDSALANAMIQFRQTAGATVMDDWPRQFWASLLSQPALKTRTAVAIAVDATDRLDELGSGPRAALLLRLAAGLDEAGAAAVLGVRTQTYRLALQQSLPHHADGRADPHAWQTLREQVHRRIKTLPARRLERLATVREAALRGSATESVPAASVASSGASGAPRPAWLMPLLWALLVVCVVAMAATFFPQLRQWTGGTASLVPGALRERAPASRYSVEAAAVTHRDFDLLADPEGVVQSTDYPFHAWLAARAEELPPAESEETEATVDTASGEAASEQE